MFDQKYNEQVLKWLQVSDTQIVSSEALAAVHYDVSVEQYFSKQLKDHMMYTVNAKILGKELPSFVATETETISMPRNPWQHFKDMYANKWFMRWLVKRWPVKVNTDKITLTATWDQWAVYPWLKHVPVSPNWEPVRIMMPVKAKVTMEDMRDESKVSEAQSDYQ